MSSNLSSFLPNVSSSIPSNVSQVLPSNASSSIPSNVSQVLPSNVAPNDNQQETLKDIQSLQNIEKDLFDTLETTPNLTSDQYNKIINKINSISQMRINLYKTFGNFNTLYKNTLVNSQDTLQQQAFAIGIIEKQLNEAKKKLQRLELEKNNKIRLIEINDYYGEKYNEYTILMKYIIFMLIPIIIISFLFNLGFIPSVVFYLLLAIITIIGSIFIIYRLLSIWSRNNMNYQEYSWRFNIKNAPSVINKKAGDNDPWLSGTPMGIGTCIGSNCCTPGMVYDNNLDKCVSASSTTTCSSKKESFINNIFTRDSRQNKKSDVTLNNIVNPSNYNTI